MTWKAKMIIHKKEKRIAVYFEKNAELIARKKKAYRFSVESNFGSLASPGHS
ncbi:hypothetical protein SAMN05444397_10180 [Flavobacterium aquidurense]|nr:hypothetical protein SAMN05444397_10180 [Flavobacterium aquidurense]